MEYRVLHIDSDPGATRHLSELLGSCAPDRFEVHSAASMGEACRLLASSAFDVIVAELGLPDGGGVAQLREGLGGRPTVPLIVWSCVEEPGADLAALREGAQDFLLKSEDRAGLCRAIRFAVERHRVVAEVVQQEVRRFKQLADTTPEMVLLLDGEGAVAYLNQAFEAGTGWSLELMQAHPKGAHAILSDAQSAGVMEMALGERGEWSGEVVIDSAAGKRIPVLASVRLMWNPDGSPAGRSMLLRDITDRKQVEERRTRERDFAFGIMDRAQGLIIVIDRSGRTVYFNAACEQLTGYSRDEVLGRPFADILIPTEERAHVMAGFQHLVSGAGPLELENNWRTKDGTLRLIHWSSSFILGDDGLPDYTISLGVDVGEMRMTEAALSAYRQHLETLVQLRDDEVREAQQAAERAHGLLECVFANTHLKIAYLDPQLRFLRVNRAYAEADGRTPEFFVGRGHFELYPHPENQAIFERAVRTGQPHHAFARPFDYADDRHPGTTYWDWTLQPVAGEHGVVDGLILSLVDVTERVMAERAATVERRRLFEMMEGIPASVHLVAADKSVPFANRYFVETLGPIVDRPCHEVLYGSQAAAGTATARGSSSRGCRLSWSADVPMAGCTSRR